jgi:uncharacterized protein YkwD
VRFAKSFLAFLLVAWPAFVASASDLSDRVLAEMNLARTQPRRYAQILAANCSGTTRDAAEAIRFLNRVRPLHPLQACSGLEQASMLHVSSQGPRGGRGHHGLGSPFSRMDKYGQRIGYSAENIYYGRRTAREIVCRLIIDSGVSGRGHRKNIFSPNFGVVGIASGYHAHYGSMCVMDFAGDFIEHGQRMAGL